MICRSIFLTAVLAAALAAQTRIALTGGMLLDGYEVPPIHHATVLIEGNHIVQAGRAEDIKIPTGTTVIDTSGQSMMPGNYFGCRSGLASQRKHQHP